MAENALHALVKSLSKSQKRYFKVYFNASNGQENNYLKIFNLIEGMTVYDENKLKAGFTAKEIRNLPSDRNYLYEQILKAMRAYMSKKNAMMELNGLQQDIQFLFENNLMKQCMKRIKKAEKLARRFEYYGVLLELLNWELEVTSKTKNKGRLESLEEAYARKERLLGLEYRQDKLQYYSSRFYLLRKVNPGESKEANLSEARDLYTEYRQFAEAAENSHYMQIRILVIEIIYALINMNQEKAFHLYQDLIQKWEERPEFINEKISLYKRALNNHLDLCVKLNRFDHFLETLEKLKSFPGRTINEEAEDFQKIYLYELLYHLNHFNFEKCIALIPTLERGFKRYKSILSAKLVAFYYNLSLVFFFSEDFDKAEEWLNKAFNMKLDGRKDMQRALRWYQVINYFETTEATTVEYILSSNYRYIVSQGIRTKWDRMLHTFFRKLVNLPVDDQQQLIQETTTEVENFLNDPANSRLAGSDEILIWFKSRAENVPMREKLAARVAEERQH